MIHIDWYVCVFSTITVYETDQDEFNVIVFRGLPLNYREALQIMHKSKETLREVHILPNSLDDGELYHNLLKHMKGLPVTYVDIDMYLSKRLDLGRDGRLDELAELILDLGTVEEVGTGHHAFILEDLCRISSLPIKEMWLDMDLPIDDLDEMKKIIVSMASLQRVRYFIYSDYTEEEDELVWFSNWLVYLKAVAEVVSIKTIELELELQSYEYDMFARLGELLDAIEGIYRSNKIYMKESDEVGEYKSTCCSVLRLMVNEARLVHSLMVTLQ